jgi:hypothetical protein
MKRRRHTPQQMILKLQGERWACRVVGQHRSSQRYEPARAEDDAALHELLRGISRERPRWGYRRARPVA